MDTAAKRYSMLNFGDGGTLVLLPAPDGTVADVLAGVVSFRWLEENISNYIDA